MSYDTQRRYTPAVSRWGERIKALRDKKGWTQEELAAAVVAAGGTMDRSRLSNIETGTNENPELVTLRNIALALEVDIAELFEQPRPEEEAGHGERAAAVSNHPGLEEIILAAVDTEFPAEDSVEGDINKAIAALNRALRRGRATSTISRAAEKNGR